MKEKKEKKGFTLIELLAVIVILAIIALIATPIVLGLISKARKGAAEDTGYGIRKESQLLYQSTLMDGETFDRIVVDFSKDMTVSGKTYPETKIYASSASTGENARLPFEIDGTKPTEGTVTIYGNGTITYSGIKVNGYTCTIPSAGKVECGEDEIVEEEPNIGTPGPDQVVNPTVTIVDKTITSVDVGNTLLLIATALDTEDPITWSSSDDTVATVSNGEVTGVSSGTVTITATAGSASDTITLTITVPTIATCPGCQFIYTTNYLAVENSTLAAQYSSDMPTGTTNDYTTLIGEGGHPYFLGLIESETNPGKIGRAFACGVENGTAFCLEGYDASKYADSNAPTLDIVFPSCNASSSSAAHCTGISVSADAYNSGPYDIVDVRDDNGRCNVYTLGNAYCS